MFENIEKALAITLLAIGVKLDGEDEVKKREKRSVWIKPWLQIRQIRTIPYQNILQELHLKDKEGTPT